MKTSVRQSISIVACFAAACSGDPRAASGETESTDAQCSDGRDNDDDGLLDCAEPSCSVFAFCGGGDAGVGDAAPDGAIPACANKVDLVFVVDISSSMHNEIEAIDEGLDRLWMAAEEAVGDVQASLVMFDDRVFTAQECSPFTEPQPLREELGRWWQCINGRRDDGSGTTPEMCDGIPTGSAEGYANGDCPENTLDALFAASTSCALRPDALRLAIHITDDTFVEYPGELSGVLVEHTYDETIEALREAELRVGAFAIPGIGEQCGAGSSANVGRGFHEPFEGKEAIPRATGGQAWDLREVRADVLDMSVAIDAFIRKESCELY